MKDDVKQVEKTFLINLKVYISIVKKLAHFDNSCASGFRCNIIGIYCFELFCVVLYYYYYLIG